MGQSSHWVREASLIGEYLGLSIPETVDLAELPSPLVAELDSGVSAHISPPGEVAGALAPLPPTCAAARCWAGVRPRPAAEADSRYEPAGDGSCTVPASWSVLPFRVRRLAGVRCLAVAWSDVLPTMFVIAAPIASPIALLRSTTEPSVGCVVLVELPSN